MEVKSQTVGQSLASKEKTKSNETEILLNKLFKPNKNDTNYFYYTEVISDWVHRK